MAVRAVLAVTLLLSGAQTASADDLKDCTSAPPDQAIVACTNLIEGGKFDSQEQAIAYTNRGVALRKKGGLDRTLADVDRAVELDSGQALSLDPKSPLAHTRAPTFWKRWGGATKPSANTRRRLRSNLICGAALRV